MGCGGHKTLLKKGVCVGPATPHITLKMGKILELKITANNINSFNMSTYGNQTIKIKLK